MKKFLPILALLFASSFISAQETIFTDDFESYTTDQTIPQQTTDWQTWGGGTTGVDAAYASTTQAHSGTKSMHIVPSNDMVYDFGGVTAGEWQMDFWIFVPTGKTGYVNMMHVFGAEWAFECYFEAGTLRLRIGQDTEPTFPYTQNSWVHLVFQVNLDEDLANISLDDVLLAEWPYSNLADGGTFANPKLDVIDFYSDAGMESYIDDFSFINTVVPPLAPDIIVDLTPINTVGVDAIDRDINNAGEQILNVSAFAKYTSSPAASDLVDGAMNYDLDNASAIGFANSIENVHVAVRMSNDVTSLHVGQQIETIDVAIGDLPIGDMTVYVWEKGGFIDPSASDVIAEVTITPVVGWNTVTLASPITITGDEIWVGYKVSVPAAVADPQSGYCLAVDGEPAIPGVNWIKTGIAWSAWTGSSTTGNGNWNIRANVTGLGWPTWLVLDQSTLEVYGDDFETLNLSFNIVGLADGNYNASVVIGCNDPDSEWNEIPVNLTIGTGIDNTTKIGVMTYPNPATENLNVVADVNINSIAIYSITGQLVNSFNVNSTSTSINVSDMAKGIYVMEVKVGNDVINSKFVVK